MRLLLWLAAFRTELRGSGHRFTAFLTKLAFRRRAWRRSWRRSRLRLGRRCAGLHRIHHLLGHGESRAETDSDARRPASTFIPRSDRHGLRYLELRVPAHVSN